MRKGQQYGVILSAIILVVAVLIWISISGLTAKETDAFFEESECGRSVISHMKSVQANKLAGSDLENAPPIECPIIDLEIEERDEEKIKRIIADKMVACWSNWQQGKEELFFEDDTYCQPCYVVDFENDDITITNFHKFLIDEKPLNRNYSYAQFLAGATNDEKFAADVLSDDPQIVASESHFTTDSRKTILFYYTKNDDEIAKIVGTGTGLAAGGTVGAFSVGGLAAGACIVATIATGGVAAPCNLIVGAAGVGLVSGGIAGGYVGANTIGDRPRWVSSVTLREYSEDELVNLGCKVAPATQTDLYIN